MPRAIPVLAWTVLGAVTAPALRAQAPEPVSPAASSMPADSAPAPESQPASQPATQPATTPSVPPPLGLPLSVEPPPLEETFTPIAALPGETPPVPFPVVLSVGPVLNPRVSVGDFHLEPHLRVRLRAAWVQPDPNVYFIGRNSGFNMMQARLGLTGGFRRSVKFALSLETAASRRSGQNQLVGELVTSLRDASFTFAPWDFLQVTAGQFRPPSDRESLSSIDAAAGAGRHGTPQLLPDQSVATRGVQAGEGLEVRGMDPGRELGFMLHGDIRPIAFVGGSYALALVNGNGQNQVLNDNNQPTAYARVTGGVRGLPVLVLADVGASLHYGRATNQSALPNTFTDEVMGGALDGVVQVFGLQLMAQAHAIQTRHLTTQSANELALGGFMQLAWRDLYGFSPVGRVAYYQPSSALPQFSVAEFTAGMRYDVPGLPLMAQFSFTHPEETGWGVYDLGATGSPRQSTVARATETLAPVRNQGDRVRTRLGATDWWPDRQDGFLLTNDRIEAVVQMAF